MLLLLMWGAAKFFTPEAEAIKPLIENSPFMSWLYRLFSVGSHRGTAMSAPAVTSPAYLGAALLTASESFERASQERASAAV